ncbi:MAG: hypothetical protein WCR95_05890 [Eubacteriales bacterium]
MKKLFAICIALMLAFTFAACTNTDPAGQSSDDVSSVNSDDVTSVSSDDNTQSIPSQTTSEPSFSEPSSSEPSFSEPASSEPSSSEPVEEVFSKLDLLFSLKVGEDISYSDLPEVQLWGPASYCVSDNGEVYIISTLDNSIIRMNDKKSIPMEPRTSASFCAFYDDVIYVLIYPNEVWLYDIEEGLIDKYLLPANAKATFVIDLKVDAQGIHIVTLEEKERYIYVFDKESFQKAKVSEYIYSKNPNPNVNNPNKTITVSANGKEVTINLQNKDASYLGYDETGIYLRETEYVPGGKFNQKEQAIRKYNFDGKLVEYAILDLSDCVLFPTKSIFFQNGKLYHMRCTYETVNLYTITLGNADVSHLYDD